MNKKPMNKILKLSLALFIFLSACKEEEPIKPIVNSEGYFIVNEGAFRGGNASLSFYDRNTKSVSNKLFFNVNGIPLGDQAQSMTAHDEKGFIVVQNSSKIEVINLNNFTLIKTITQDIVSPRYFVGSSPNKGYVSDWGKDGGISGTVKVIDLVTYRVTKTIATGQGTNRLLLHGTNLYVVNSGGTGRDSTLQIIDTNTDMITNTITLADNPNSLQLDKEENIWIATSGHTEYDPVTFNILEDKSTPGTIIKINKEGDLLLKLTYTEVGFSKSPKNLSINPAGDRLYYLYDGAIYSISISASVLSSSPFIDKDYYGLGVDPIDGTIIGCESPNFRSSGNIDIYDATGMLMETHAVGIGPNGCYFK